MNIDYSIPDGAMPCPDLDLLEESAVTSPPAICWRAGPAPLPSNAGGGTNVLGEQLQPQSVAAWLRNRDEDRHPQARRARAKNRSSTPPSRTRPFPQREAAAAVDAGHDAAPASQGGGDGPEDRLRRL